MTFSWTQMKEDAIKIKLRREKTLARSQHPDFKLKHPDEARDASGGKYIILTNRILKEMKVKQEQAMQRRDKLL